MTDNVNQMTFEKNSDGSVSSKINNKVVGRGRNKKAVDVDSSMSETSENPVQNKVIDEAMKTKANLVNNKVPEEELPSYVDDVINGYYNDVDGKFYEHYESGTYSDEITPEDGKIYVDLITDVTFRWSGSVYVQVGPTGPVVIANPTLAGTEPDLEGLQVGNQKYKVPGGGGSGEKLYRHSISIICSSDSTTKYDVYFDLILTTSTPFSSYLTLQEYFVTNVAVDNNKRILANGTWWSSVLGTKQNIVALTKYSNSSDRFGFITVTQNNTYSENTQGGVNTDAANVVTDTVTQVASDTINVAPDVELYWHEVYLEHNSSHTRFSITFYSNSNNSTENTSELQNFLINTFTSENYHDDYVYFSGIYFYNSNSKPAILTLSIQGTTEIPVLYMNIKDGSQSVEVSLSNFNTIHHRVKQIL